MANLIIFVYFVVQERLNAHKHKSEHQWWAVCVTTVPGWGLGCPKQVESEREEAEKVWWRVQMDEGKLLFEIDK